MKASDEQVQSQRVYQAFVIDLQFCRHSTISSARWPSAHQTEAPRLDLREATRDGLQQLLLLL